jgi:hypothetical protein
VTYPNDPNMNRRDNIRDETSYTSWIIGGIVMLAVILGIFMLVGRDSDTNTASNANSPPTTSRPASSPSTTGSGTTTPAPAPASPAR